VSVWGACAPRAMVGGDATLPLSCGWDWFLGDWTVVPEQPIYGYGLCATAAPLFWGVESLSDLALRRSFLGAAVVPLSWLLVRSGASLILPLSPLAVRVGAALAALVVLRHPDIGWLSMVGVNGYFAGPLVCLALLSWVLACKGRTWAAVLALGLIPIAMMNHPFTLWLLPASVPLAWLVASRGGKAWLFGGTAVALGVSWPRLCRLRESLAHPDARTTAIAVDAEMSELWRELSDSTLDYSNLAFVIGAVVLCWGSRRSKDQAFGRAWAWAGGLGVLTVLSLGAGLKYLRYYHLIWLFPFVLLPLCAAAARAFDLLEASVGRERLPPALRAVLCSALVVGLGGVALTGPRVPLDPWCPPGELDSQTAGGASQSGSAIFEDLQNHPSERAVIVGNLNSGAAAMDSAFPVLQDLVLRGVPVSRLSCCTEGQSEPLWYWLISPLGDALDTALFGGIPGAEVLRVRPQTGEWLVVLRTSAARAVLKRRLCSAFGPDKPLFVTSHDAAMTRLPGRLPDALQVPVVSWNCEVTDPASGARPPDDPRHQLGL
jgi:hypothetical protein